MENFNETSMMTRRFVETQNATLTYFEEPQESYNSILEALIEDSNATQTYHQPNFLYDHHAQHFEESKDYPKSNLEIIMEEFIEAQTLSRVESMMTKHFEETENATLAPFEEPQESHNFNFETSMEDSDEMLTHSRLEAMMKHFVETQTVQNQEFIKQSLQNNETLRQLTTMVESLATHNMTLETQISQLEQNLLGTFLEKYVDVERTISEKQIEIPEESDNEIEESDYEIEESDDVVEKSSSEKRVEIDKNPPTLSEREVVEEVERKTPIVIPFPYTPPISFPQSFVEAKVDSKSIMYVKILENIHTNAPLFEVLHKKRNLDDHETKDIISDKRVRLTFEVVDNITKPEHEKLILRIDPEPPPRFQKNEPPHRRKKRKGEGYVRWLDKWPWKMRFVKSSTEESFSREPP